VRTEEVMSEGSHLFLGASSLHIYKIVLSSCFRVVITQVNGFESSLQNTKQNTDIRDSQLLKFATHKMAFPFNIFIQNSVQMNFFCFYCCFLPSSYIFTHGTHMLEGYILPSNIHNIVLNIRGRVM
jgi:hypothetical protein